jgi:hypothetical protein
MDVFSPVLSPSRGGGQAPREPYDSSFELPQKMINPHLPREVQRSLGDLCQENWQNFGAFLPPKFPLFRSDRTLESPLRRHHQTPNDRRGGISPWNRIYGGSPASGRFSRGGADPSKTKSRFSPRQVVLARRSDRHASGSARHSGVRRGNEPKRTDYMAYYSPAAIRDRRDRLAATHPIRGGASGRTPKTKSRPRAGRSSTDGRRGKPRPENVNNPSARKVTMGHAPGPGLLSAGWSGPRGWFPGEPELAPGHQARIRDDDLPPMREVSGAVSCPELNFAIQRESFGMHSISKKFALLSLPRSKHSSVKLQKRCFSMHLVRGNIARGHDSRERHQRYAPYERTFDRDLSSPSSGSSPEPELVPRTQWMRDAQPDLSDEEADAIWRAGSSRLLGEAAHLSSGPNPSSFTGGNTQGYCRYPPFC